MSIAITFKNDEAQQVEVAVGTFGVTWEQFNGKPYDGTNTGGMDQEGISDEDMETYNTLVDQLTVKAKELYEFMQTREAGYKMIWEDRHLQEAA